MSEIEIRSSSLPHRCEICHQDDCFDANTNTCSRCANIPLPPPALAPSLQPPAPAQKVFTTLCGSIAILSLILLFVVALLSEFFLKKFFIKWGLPPFIIYISIVMVANYLFLQYIKNKIIASLPNSVRLIATKVEAFPQLDIHALHQYSQQLKELGFQSLGDIMHESEGGVHTPGFARIFFHPQHHFITEVNQVFPLNAPPNKMAVAFITYYENGWAYGSSNREPDAVSYTIRRKDRLYHTYPHLTVAEIFRTHLKYRDLICHSLHSPLRKIDSLTEYIANEEEVFKGTKPHVSKINIIKMIIEGLIFEYIPKYEWLGKYQKVIKANSKEIS